MNNWIYLYQKLIYAQISEYICIKIWYEYEYERNIRIEIFK